MRPGMRLEGYQRRYLRGLAHGLKPTVQVGKAGLSAAVLAAVDAALDTHELIKVRLAGDKAEKTEMVAALESKLGCSEVSLVGHVLTAYRQQPDVEKRKVALPRRAP